MATNGFYMLTESVEQIEAKILKALREEINSKLIRTLAPIQARMRELTYNFIKQAPEYDALIFGELYGQFGFWAGSAEGKVERVLNAAISQVRAEYIQINNTTKNGFYAGGIRIYIIDSDFKQLLTADDAKIRTEKGYTLTWLDWLLTKGNQIIIDDYLFYPTYQNPRSRSGDGLMRKTKKRRKFWRVPPEYQGTIRNNWFTRALRGTIDIFASYTEKIIEEEINKVLYV